MQSLAMPADRKVTVGPSSALTWELLRSAEALRDVPVNGVCSEVGTGMRPENVDAARAQAWHRLRKERPSHAASATPSPLWNPWLGLEPRLSWQILRLC